MAPKWIEPCGNDFTPSKENKNVCANCGWARKKHICNCGCGLGAHLAALLVVFALTLAAGAQEKPTKPHAFFDKTNLALFSADALVRSLDAQSTRAFETNPCRCMVEENLPQSIALSSPKMYAYSLGVAGAMVGAAYVLHRTGHHRLERLLPLADAAQDSRDVIGNYRLIATKGH